MKITNEAGLHRSLVRAIEEQERKWYSGHKEERFGSVTELLKPATMVILERRHADEVTEEAMGRLWALQGSALHKIIELGAVQDELVEQRLGMEVSGKKITGGVDLLRREDGEYVITDFKWTSAWTYYYGDRLLEWERQINLYALLYRRAGFEVKRCEICMLFRDWQAQYAEGGRRYKRNYPPQQSVTLPVRLWDEDQAYLFAANRVAALVVAETRDDSELALCHEDDRWVGSSGESIRCERYCAVKPFCVPYSHYIQEEVPA